MRERERESGRDWEGWMDGGYVGGFYYGIKPSTLTDMRDR